MMAHKTHDNLAHTSGRDQKKIVVLNANFFALTTPLSCIFEIMPIYVGVEIWDHLWIHLVYISQTQEELLLTNGVG